MFNKLQSAFVSFVKDENGPTAVEYAVMLALIIVVWITAVTALGTNASTTFSKVASATATWAATRANDSDTASHCTAPTTTTWRGRSAPGQAERG